MTKIELHVGRCIGNSTCVLTCPEVFDQDDDGTVLLLHADVPNRSLEKVRAAIDACPTQVISLAD